MRSTASSSPMKANGAIIAPVLTPVTASNCGRASSPLTWPHPFSTPAPKAPQSPPPEITSMSMVGRGPPGLAALTLRSARCTSCSLRCRAAFARARSSACRAATRSSIVRGARSGALAQPAKSATAATVRNGDFIFGAPGFRRSSTIAITPPWSILDLGPTTGPAKKLTDRDRQDVVAAQHVDLHAAARLERRGELFHRADAPRVDADDEVARAQAMAVRRRLGLDRGHQHRAVGPGKAGLADFAEHG